MINGELNAGQAFLATPAIWLPGQSQEEWEAEVDAMLERSYITDQFMKGHVYVDSFLDYIAENLVDPFEIWLPG